METPVPNPPIVSVLAYFCTKEEVLLANPEKKISNRDIRDFYQKICKKPFQVICHNKDLYSVIVEYRSDDEIIELLREEGLFKDEADEDLFRVSIERLTEMIAQAGGQATMAYHLAMYQIQR